MSRNVINVQDGGMGSVAVSEWLPLVVGYANGATANTLYRFNTGASEVISTVGRGPGAALTATIASHQQCLFLATAASTAGSCSAVTKDPVGTSTGTITVAGTPNDAYKLRIRITTSGTNGAGRFQFALDGYSNTEAKGWSPILTIPTGGTYAITGTDLTLTFVPGAGAVFFEAGDTHYADCVAPHFTTADLTAAFATLRAQLGSLRCRRVFFAGESATASAAITLASAIGGHLDTLADAGHFSHSVYDGGSSENAAAYLSAKAAFADDRVSLVHVPGGARRVSVVPFTGYAAPTVPASHVVAERLAQTPLSESGGRVLSGNLEGVEAIGSDEEISPRFTDQDRTITLCSYPGKIGFYIRKPFITSAPTSSFEFFQWGCVLDEGCETSYDALGNYIEANLKAKTDGTGNLLDEEAAKIEGAVVTQLSNRLIKPTTADGSGHVSGLTYTIDRTNDYLETGDVNGTLKIVPLRAINRTITTVSLSRTA